MNFEQFMQWHKKKLQKECVIGSKKRIQNDNIMDNKL